MAKIDRLFDIIQQLRTTEKPVTAKWLSERLEVSERTIYRDIAVLQGQGVPIDGEAGIGYMLRSGYELPPLMFSAEELEALMLGARLTMRTGDMELASAASTAISKIAHILPKELSVYNSPSLYAPGQVTDSGNTKLLSDIRRTIRDCLMINITYRDLKNQTTQRDIRPLAIIYFNDANLLAGWCEARQDYRHFRIDRIEAYEVSDSCFETERRELFTGWLDSVEAP